MTILFICLFIALMVGFTAAGYEAIGTKKKQPESIESKINTLEADLDSKSIYAMIREGEEKVGDISAKWRENEFTLLGWQFTPLTVDVDRKLYYTLVFSDSNSGTRVVYVQHKDEWLKYEVGRNQMSGRGLDMSVGETKYARAAVILHLRTVGPEEFIKIGEPVELDPVEDDREYTLSYGPLGELPVRLKNTLPDGDFSDVLESFSKKARALQKILDDRNEVIPDYPEDITDEYGHTLLYNGVSTAPEVLRGRRPQNTPKPEQTVRVVNETFRDALHKAYVYQDLAKAQERGLSHHMVLFESGEREYYSFARKEGYWWKL